MNKKIENVKHFIQNPEIIIVPFTLLLLFIQTKDISFTVEGNLKYILKNHNTKLHLIKKSEIDLINLFNLFKIDVG